MSKCEKCGKSPAHIHYLQITPKGQHEGWLCKDCAEEIGMDKEVAHILPPEAFNSGFGDFLLGAGLLSAFSSLMSKFGETSENMGLAIPNVSVKNDTHGKKGVCITCGTDMEAFSSGKRNGCEDCAPVFNRRMDYIKSFQVRKLNEQLKVAVENENYEEAARIRDSIKKIGENNM